MNNIKYESVKGAIKYLYKLNQNGGGLNNDEVKKYRNKINQYGKKLENNYDQDKDTIINNIQSSLYKLSGGGIGSLNDRDTLNSLITKVMSNLEKGANEKILIFNNLKEGNNSLKYEEELKGINNSLKEVKTRTDDVTSRCVGIYEDYSNLIKSLIEFALKSLKMNFVKLDENSSINFDSANISELKSGLENIKTILNTTFNKINNNKKLMGDLIIGAFYNEDTGVVDTELAKQQFKDISTLDRFVSEYKTETNSELPPNLSKIISEVRSKM